MEINIAELEASIAQLTPEELKQQLLDAKVKQRVNSKKYNNTETQKKARLKKAAKLKAQAELAKTMPATDPQYKNLYEQIMAEAAKLADAKLEADAEVEDEGAEGEGAENEAA